MDVFLTVIIAIVAVLQIMFIVKIWQMTNDVRLLKNNLVGYELTDEEVIVRAYLQKDPNLEAIVFEKFYKRAVQVYVEGVYEDSRRCVEYYKTIYKKVGLDMPAEIAEIDTQEKMGIYLMKKTY